MSVNVSENNVSFLFTRRSGGRMAGFMIVLAVLASGCGDRADRTYRRGLNLAHREKYEQAVVEMRRLINMETPSSRAHNALGQIYRSQNLYNRAIEELNLALETAADTDPIPAYNLGCLYRELEDWEKAISFYEKSLQADPGFSPALYRLGAAYADMGRDEEAIRYFRKFLDSKPDHPAPGYNNLGVLLWKSGDRDSAIKFMEKAIKAESEFPPALFNYGLSSLLGDQNPKKGIEALIKYLKLRPRSTRAVELKRLLRERGAISSSEKELISHQDYIRRGGEYEKAGQYRRAKEEYLLALKIQPDSEQAHYRLGIIYDKFLGDKVRAIKHYQAFLSGNRKSPRATEVIASLKTAREEVGEDNLITAGLRPTPLPLPAPGFTPVPEASTPSAEDHYREGRKLEESGDLEGARNAYRRALELQGDSATALSRLGRVSLSLGEYSQAVDSLSRARELDPDLPVGDLLARAYLRLAAVTSSDHQYNRALEYCRLARKEDPSAPVEEELWKIHRAAYRHNLESGNYSEAEDHLLSCLRLKPEVSGDYALLGDLYAEKLNRPGEARRHYREYLRRTPRGPEAERIKVYLYPPEPTPQPTPAPERPGARTSAMGHLRLGATYQKAGRTAAAEEEYLRALEIDPELYQAHYNLGLIYSRRGDNNLALAAFKEAAALKPDFPRVQLAIFNLYYHEFRMKNLARPYARKYIELAPDTPQARTLSRWLQE